MKRVHAAAVLVLAGIVAGSAVLWHVRTQGKVAPAARKPAAAIPVVTGLVEQRAMPVHVRANGNVVALQSVDIRPQVMSTVREVHIREGQFVRPGELLFTLDSRAEEATLQKASAQVEKDRSDLAAATRNFERQRALFEQKFISQAALDTAQSRVDTLNGQLAVDQAAVQAARVARAYTEIRASFGGRTGAVSVRPGSLVQPNAAPLVTVTQIDPIAIAFTVPEKELSALQDALAAGAVAVEANLEGVAQTVNGRVTFVDNAVDTTTGSIRVKGEFANPQARLWPGMFVKVSLAPRVLRHATVVPAQAVQTGPDGHFVYVIDASNRVTSQLVTEAYVEEGAAVVEGVASGTRIVVEGAQNLRPGSLVADANAPRSAVEAKSKKNPA